LFPVIFSLILNTFIKQPYVVEEVINKDVLGSINNLYKNTRNKPNIGISYLIFNYSNVGLAIFSGISCGCRS